MANIFYFHQHSDSNHGIEDALERMGHAVVSAADAPTALDVIGSGGVDLIISASDVEGLSATSLLNLLRESGRSVPVIVLTTTGIDHIDPDLRKNAAAVLDHHPCHPELLQHAVSRLLVRATLRRENALLREARERLALLELAVRPALAVKRRDADVRSPSVVVVTSLNVDRAEDALITRALQVTGGNRTRAAELLGCSVRTLRNKLNARRVVA